MLFLLRCSPFLWWSFLFNYSHGLLGLPSLLHAPQGWYLNGLDTVPKLHTRGIQPFELLLGYTNNGSTYVNISIGIPPPPNKQVSVEIDLFEV
ncbi:hypothetical protein M501DRAFT_54142 [Patellaria atrata CBS 101060]|uniref:Uncharacterized protein n=1 Tax=Patellaria atrata CBS 101060 TaxID=1346257 RepID=A0A9P4SK43_9PEZI|nr:hypothetical protein M501DRAFT_54142 [Patellaria atrata CBS 101060]